MSTNFNPDRVGDRVNAALAHMSETSLKVKAGIVDCNKVHDITKRGLENLYNEAYQDGIDRMRHTVEMLTEMLEVKNRRIMWAKSRCIKGMSLHLDSDSIHTEEFYTHIKEIYKELDENHYEG
jgi:hypothetical protein